MISDHVRQSEEKAKTLERSMKDMSEGQKSIAITAFANIREKQLNRKLYNIRQVQRITEEDLKNIGTVNNPEIFGEIPRQQTN